MEEVYIAYAALITLATVAIYAGAWGSLPVGVIFKADTF